MLFGSLEVDFAVDGANDHCHQEIHEAECEWEFLAQVWVGVLGKPVEFLDRVRQIENVKAHELPDLDKCRIQEVIPIPQIYFLRDFQTFVFSHSTKLDLINKNIPYWLVKNKNYLAQNSPRVYG